MAKTRKIGRNQPKMVLKLSLSYVLLNFEMPTSYIIFIVRGIFRRIWVGVSVGYECEWFYLRLTDPQKVLLIKNQWQKTMTQSGALVQ